MTTEEKIIIVLSKKPKKNRVILDSLKREFAKKEKSKMAPNSLLLEAYHSLVKNKRIKKDLEIEDVLRIRKVRSLSGIVIVSVLTKPYPCPGKCLYCPEQIGSPKSYLKEEPAVARAIKLQYHPYKQIQARIRALEATGHPTDKIDLRIIGATWSFYPKNYQTWFIKECFEGANLYQPSLTHFLPPPPILPLPEGGGGIKGGGGLKREKRYKLEQIQNQNEKAKHRIIGITIETRPDFIDKKEIKRLRELGVTRVELGVQSIYNDVLKLNRRGHNIQATIEATKLLKNAGFKVCYQMMPNLPGSNIKKDIEMFRQLFSNPDFCPDYLKIYPCALLKEAPLYKLWQKGKYKPYTEKQLLKLLIEIKKLVPYYCRIQRIIRDIPSYYIIEGGTKTSNLRQIIAKISKQEGWRCKCIRCREVKEKYNPKEKLFLFREDYDASGGKEILLSFENKNRTRLYSLLRLRIARQTVLPILKNAAIIRELHTYGKLIPIAQKEKAPQHKGLGKKLMKEAEKITKKEFGLHPVKSASSGAAEPQFNRVKKIVVISGVGVRGYYRKLGYRLKQTYMIKSI